MLLKLYYYEKKKEKRNEKIFKCTHELPLRMQLNDEDLLMISEIHLEGYLDGEDMLLLSDMSNLKILDMSGVTELKVSFLDSLDDGECSGNFIPFYPKFRSTLVKHFL